MSVWGAACDASWLIFNFCQKDGWVLIKPGATAIKAIKNPIKYSINQAAQGLRLSAERMQSES